MVKQLRHWLGLLLSAAVLLQSDAQRSQQKKIHGRQELDVSGLASPPLVTSSGNSNATVEEFKCKSAGFFANDADCGLFYRCVDYFGTGEHFSLFTFQCAPGTIFDESISVCNHPGMVSSAAKCLKSVEGPAGGASSPQGSEVPSIAASEGGKPTGSSPSSENLVSVTTEASTSGTTTCVCTTTPSPSAGPTPAPPTPAAPTQAAATSAPVELTRPTTTSAPTTIFEGSTAPSAASTDASIDASSSEPTTLSPTTEVPAIAVDSQTTVSGASTSESEPSTVSPLPAPPGVPVAGSPHEAFVLVCGDQAFHRHPLDCKLYYQCIWSGFAFTFNLYSCQGDNYYDEASGSCTSPDKTAPCELKTMPALPVTNVTALPGAVTTVSPSTVSSPQYTLAPGSLYDCPKPGHFPYQLDCIRFYRCFEITPGVLKGLLYRCPPGYGYSKTSERCEKEEALGTCDISVVRKGSIPVPVLPLEQAIMVPVKDFNYFFNNPNFFYFPRQSNRRILLN